MEVVFFTIFLCFFHLQYRKTSAQDCYTSLCGTIGPPIRFPFWLKHYQSQAPYPCGYPGFDLSCNNMSQTVINLPSAGKFIVRGIDYARQVVTIKDPGNCIPNRFPNFSLLGSSFDQPVLKNFTLLNCSSDTAVPPRKSISCLGGENYSVVAVPTKFLDEYPINSSCREFSTVMAPRQWYNSLDLSSEIRLTWSGPDCRSCEQEGGVCGFERGADLEIGCSNLRSKRGLPRSAKYGLIIGVGIPGFLVIIGLVGYVYGRIRNYGQRHPPNTEFSTSTGPQPFVILMGLDGATIESYPKTVLGESRRLPKPSDGTCPICLSDYQPKEALRTIPECNHYFHAKCVDEWLTMNATCPLCRNSPEGPSSLVSPSSSTISSSSVSTL